MILPLGVILQLRAIEVDVPQLARGVPHRLVVEVRRLRIATFTAGGNRLRAHAVAELDDGDEAVATGTIHLLRTLVGARAERRERSPSRGREPDRDARPRVAEGLDDVAGEPLESIDVAPWRLP